MKPSADYLVESGMITIKLLKSESLIECTTLLKNGESPNDLRDLLNSFFIPYEISFIKFSMNLNYVQEKEYLYDQLYDDINKHKEDHSAPSLRVLFHNFKDILPGYNEDFIAAFPDVINWAKDGEGLHVVREMYNHMGKGRLIPNEFFHKKVLFWIIEEYHENTGKQLECRIYRPGKHHRI